MVLYCNKSLLILKKEAAANTRIYSVKINAARTMENLIISANLVLPFFLLMAVGYLFRKLGLIDDEFRKKANTLTFKILIPSLLFCGIYNADYTSGNYFKMMVFIITSTLIIFFTLWLIVPKFEKNNKYRGAIIQGTYRSNYILFAIPIVSGLYGQQGAGTAALMNIAVVPLYNILAVFILLWYSTRQTGYKKVFSGIITNPMVLASFFAILLVWLGIKLPYVADKAITDISLIATPLAFILLGSSFKFRNIKKYGNKLLFSVFAKLLLIPLIFIPLGILAGFTGMELSVLVVIFAAPTAITSYMMAEQMNSEGDLAGQIVVFSSLFSIITVFLFIFVLKTLAYI